jgi:hypothetical protein
MVLNIGKKGDGMCRIVKWDQPKDIRIQQIQAAGMRQDRIQYAKKQCQKVSSRSRFSIPDVKEFRH